MRTFTVIAQSVRLSSGHVLLTDAQYKVRSHCLKFGKKNIYAIALPIEFKIGETFGYDGELSKSIADCLESVKSKSKPKAESVAAHVAEPSRNDAEQSWLNNEQLQAQYPDFELYYQKLG